jgi:hypothetical protein
MSLGLEEGSEQNAPLGRAVIGGMAFSTFITLLVLPAIFTLLMTSASAKSPSLDPDDVESSHYDPIRPSQDGHAHHPLDGRRSDGQNTGEPSTTTGPQTETTRHDHADRTD